ncbi:hypothetical protein J6590_014645 [Homalodisca vitripennis]|nr:hypothetical protein J6590_014645 [Homalodisca vitripennis]
MADFRCSLRNSEIDREVCSNSDISDVSDASSVGDLNDVDDNILLTEQSDSESAGESNNVADLEPGEPTTSCRRQTCGRVPPPWSRTITYTEPNLFYSDFGPSHTLPVGSDVVEYFIGR